MIVVEWRTRLWNAGWVTPPASGASEHLFSRWNLHRIPRNVRAPELGARLHRAMRGTRFLDWWHEVCGGPGEKLFLLKFRDGAWDIPWEWLVGQLLLVDNRRTVSLVRTLEDQTPVFEPARFGKPLKVLILQGDDGASINAKLDLAAEANAVTKAWEGLERSIKERFLAPVVKPATDGTLVELLDTEEPDLVWFSGHGRHHPEPGLLFADGRWIGPGQIGSLLQRTKCKPKFWLLMACDTARGGRTLQDLPAFVAQFFAANALSVLAMQSPIRDVSALLLATEMLSALAVGESLEAGLGRARTVLSSVLSDGVHPMDWATPVIWTSTRLVGRWEWSDVDDDLVKMQYLGREFLRTRLANPAQLAPASTKDEATVAEAWVASRKTWVHSDPSDAEVRARWFRVLESVQRAASQFVVEIDCENENVESALQQWAEGAYSRLLPGTAPEAIARALYLLKSHPVAGWQALAGMRFVFLGVANPPDFSTHEWFWQPLRTGSNTRVAVLSSLPLPEMLVGDWALDKIESAMNVPAILAALQEAPRLARALAVLREPIGYSLVQLRGENVDEPRSLDQWPHWRTALLDLPGAGPLMSASARQQMLHSMTDTQLRAAHRDCAKMLSRSEVPATVRIREETLFHAIQAKDWEPALIEAETLCMFYRWMDRPRGVVETVRLLSTHARDLGSRAVLPVAWAYAQLGDHGAADFWLRRAVPTAPLDRAWAKGLDAELRKSRGDREGAKEAIDSAIEICRAALQEDSTDHGEIERRLRNYRQDKARIMHFLFYDLEGALKEYQQLIADWSDQPEAEFDLAIVRRNYAECLRSLATGPDDARMLVVHDALNDAESTARKYRDSPLLSEVLYEQARLAEAEGHDADSRDLLSKCIQAARSSGHFQVLAIAQARMFWSDESFSYDRWQQIDADLELYPEHGWSVRTLLNGRLRAARRLEDAGRTQSALEILDAAQSVVTAHPAFRGRSDLLRAAQIAAGRDVLTRSLGKLTSAWQDFRGQHPGLYDDNLKSAEQIWKEVS